MSVLQRKRVKEYSGMPLKGASCYALCNKKTQSITALSCTYNPSGLTLSWGEIEWIRTQARLRCKIPALSVKFTFHPLFTLPAALTAFRPTPKHCPPNYFLCSHHLPPLLETWCQSSHCHCCNLPSDYLCLDSACNLDIRHLPDHKAPFCSPISLAV